MFGFEGVAAGSTTVRLICYDPNGAEWGRDEVVVTLADVQVDWVDAGGTLIVDPNDHPVHAGQPDGRLGWRWYPGALVPGGGWNDTVKARVTLEPRPGGQALAGLTVYLREFDPDDPSANNTVVDGDLTGGDNRSGRCSDAIRRVEWTAPALGRRVNRLEWNITNE